MYLGDESVRTLATYLYAYEKARADLQLPAFGKGEETLLSAFHSWLEARLSRHSTLGWSHLIEVADPSPKSIYTFIAFFDEFLKQAAGIAQGLANV
jgi:hypothetical protein